MRAAAAQAGVPTFPCYSAAAVVERLGAAAKRPHTSLASQLDSMSLAGSGAAAGQAPAAATDNAHNLSRFSRLTTLSAAEISSLSQMQLAMLLEAQRLRQQQEQHEVQRQQELAAQTDAEGQAAAAPAAGAAVGAPAVAATAAGPGAAAAGARYEQIRQPARRRGLSLFQATESGPDPLAGFATIYEVVRHEQQVAREQAGSGKRHRGRVHDGQPPSWQAFPEGTLMCNDQPAVREPAAAAAALGVDGAAQMDVASEEAQDEGHGGGEDGDQEDDYVYDLYCPAVEEGEGADRWMELHASGRAPVIQVGCLGCPGVLGLAPKRMSVA